MPALCFAHTLKAQSSLHWAGFEFLKCSDLLHKNRQVLANCCLTVLATIMIWKITYPYLSDRKRLDGEFIILSHWFRSGVLGSFCSSLPDCLIRMGSRSTSDSCDNFDMSSGKICLQTITLPFQDFVTHFTGSLNIPTNWSSRSSRWKRKCPGHDRGRASQYMKRSLSPQLLKHQSDISTLTRDLDLKNSLHYPPYWRVYLLSRSFLRKLSQLSNNSNISICINPLCFRDQMFL